MANHCLFSPYIHIEMLGDEYSAKQLIRSDGKPKTKAQRLRRITLQLQMFKPGISLWRRIRILFSFIFSLFLDLLAGFGYYPGRTLIWYLFMISVFCINYSISGHIHLLPDALTFSLMSFHGRGFFPSFSSETTLHSPLVVGAAIEAVIGLFIEISFIATFTQRFFGR